MFEIVYELYKVDCAPTLWNMLTSPTDIKPTKPSETLMGQD